MALFFLFSFVFTFTAYSRDRKPAAEVLTADLPFIPRHVGYFFAGHELVYYAGNQRQLVFINNSFKKTGYYSFSGDVSAFDFADINRDGLDDLIEFSDDRVFAVYQKSVGVFGTKKLIVEGDFFAPSRVQHIEEMPLGYDFDHDGDFDLLLPAVGHFQFFENDSGEFTLKKRLSFEHRSRFTDRFWKNSDLRSNYIKSTTYIPRLYFYDLNGDGVTDAYCRVKSNVYYYTSRKNNDGSIEALSRFRLKNYPVSLASEYASLSQVDDLDMDGKPDLIFSVIKGLGLKIRTEVHIFWGGEDLPDAKKHTQLLQKGGFFAPFVVHTPFKKYLMIPTMDLGVSFFATYIIRSRLPVSAILYDIKNRELVEKDYYSLSFEVEGNLLPGFTSGDFDKDDHSDFALGHTLDSLQIYRGNKEMSEELWQTVKVPSYGIFKKVERRGEKDQLLIYLPQSIKKYDRKKLYLLKF